MHRPAGAADTLEDIERQKTLVCCCRSSGDELTESARCLFFKTCLHPDASSDVASAGHLEPAQPCKTRQASRCVSRSGLFAIQVSSAADNGCVLPLLLCCKLACLPSQYVPQPVALLLQVLLQFHSSKHRHLQHFQPRQTACCGTLPSRRTLGLGSSGGQITCLLQRSCSMGCSKRLAATAAWCSQPLTAAACTVR